MLYLDALQLHLDIAKYKACKKGCLLLSVNLLDYRDSFFPLGFIKPNSIYACPVLVANGHINQIRPFPHLDIYGSDLYPNHCWLEHVRNSKKNARTSRTYF